MSQMKLRKLLDHDFVKDFQKLIKTDFENELFVASLRNYCSHGNPLRFHNFAFSMRELVLKIIDRNAPDKEVMKVSWYEKEHEKHKVTRRQKLKYCAQGFISDSYFNELQLEDLNENIKDYLKEFNFFNKYTHITKKHYISDPKTFYDDMKFIIQRSTEMIEGIYSLEDVVINRLKDNIQESVFQAVINESPRELSVLASNVLIDQVHPEELTVTYLEHNGITLYVEGTVYVTQEYGKGEDFTEISENYPFSITVNASVDNSDSISVNTEEFTIDTSSWYE